MATRKSKPAKDAASKLAAKETNPVLRAKALYALAPWSCKHHADHSEIEAYVVATGVRQIVADVPQSAGVNAEEMANFITAIVNDHDKLMDILDDMITALETCLDSKGLDWSAENEADITLRRARQMLHPHSSTSGNA